MFRTEAIILKKTLIRSDRMLVVLLTREFGKIHVWYRRTAANIGDTGSLMDGFLYRRDGVTFLHNPCIRMSLVPLDHTYSELFLVLELSRVLNMILPEGMENTRIFDDYKMVYSAMQSTEGCRKGAILFLFRLLKILWILNPTPFSQTGLSAFYTHIDRVDMTHILTSEKVSSEQLLLIERHTFSSLNSYLA